MRHVAKGIVLAVCLMSTAAAGDDERYLRERPPHWE